MPANLETCDICCDPTAYIHAESNREAVVKVLCAIYNATIGDNPGDNSQFVLNGVSYPVQTLPFSAALASDNTILAVATGHEVIVLGWVMSAAAPVNATWKTGATSKIGPMHVGTTGGSVGNPGKYPWFRGADGEDLILTLDGVVNVGGGVIVAVIDTPVP